MYVNPGELNKKIKILRISGKDSDGFRTGEPTVIRSCYAKYTRKISDAEIAGAGVKPSAKAVTRFLIRYTTTIISSDMKVRYNNRYYDIQDVNDIGDRHEYIELYCKEGGL